MKEQLKQLAKTLEGDLFFDKMIRTLYATDASSYRELPLAVAIPKTKEDISKLIRFASTHQTSLIPRTAGTSLAGQVVGNGIIVDVSKHFNQILELNKEEGWVRVQPGVIRDELNLFLQPHGLFFGPETSTANRAMIGGMVGNNSSGTTSIRYGVTRDKIVELRGDGKDDIGNNWYIGKPLRVFFDYNMIGIWQTGEDYTMQPGAAAGAAKLEDVDGNGNIDANDRKIIGSKNPRYTASFANRLSYKNFYASALLTGVFGVWRDDHMANMGAWTFGITNYVHGANYWTPENPNATIVSPGYLNNQGHGYYKKVNYVQVRNITFGYRVPQNIAKKIGLSGIDINASVNNLHTFSNIRQVLNYDNTWMASYPTARSYMFGLNVNF